MIKNFIINLYRGSARVEPLQSCFQDLGLTFERTSAADRRQMPETEIAQRNQQGDTWPKGRAGCLLNHFRVWEKA